LEVPSMWHRDPPQRGWRSTASGAGLSLPHLPTRTRVRRDDRYTRHRAVAYGRARSVPATNGL